MGNNSAESPEDCPTHKSEREFRLCSPHIIQIIHNKLLLSLLSSAGIFGVFGHDVCQHNIQKGQQMCTDIRWVRAFSMASRSKAHETLLLLLTQDGVLSACIYDNVKEMIQGKFIRSSKILHVSWISWSHILPCQMLQKKILKSLRKGPGESCCSQEHQNPYGMTA